MTPTPDDEARSVWDRLGAIPDAPTAPTPSARTPTPGPPAANAPSPAADAPRAEPVPDAPTPDVPTDPRRIQIGAPAPPAGGVPQSPGPPTPGVPTPDVAPARRRRRRGRWVGAIGVVLLLALVSAGGLALYASSKWNGMERVDTGGRLDPSAGFTNYLIVGTDSRAAIDADDPVARDVGLGFDGERSDSMLILHTGPSGNHIVSLPRDLLVDIPGNGRNKLNAARAFGGAPLLIETIQTQLAVPIHRYLEVDLAGFMSVVNAVGGVPVDFPSAVCDPKSGLDIRSAGKTTLDRRTALQYVRSRTYTEFDAAQAGDMTCAEIRQAGLGTVDQTSDIGRTQRQRDFLLTTLDKAAGSRNPITLIRVLDGLGGGLRVDDAMGFGDALTLARKARGLNADNHALPVASAGNDLVTTSETGAVLDLFR